MQSLYIRWRHVGRLIEEEEGWRWLYNYVEDVFLWQYFIFTYKISGLEGTLEIDCLLSVI